MSGIMIFELFSMVKITVVLLGMTPCSLVCGYKHFKVTCFLIFYPEDGDSRLL